MANALTNMPSVWADLGLSGMSPMQNNADILSEQEKLARRKKIMAAGSTQFASAAQMLLGSRTGNSNTVM